MGVEMPNPVMRTFFSELGIEGIMANNTARMGRRRRVLKEEVLAAGNTASDEMACAPGDTPRYGVGANIENHPQITDFVPRRFRTIGLILGLGLSVGVVAELVAHYSENLSEFAPTVTANEIATVFSYRLMDWTSAALLLVAAVYARLIFSLRRHRVDDYRGRYRIWRTASWAAAFLSLNSVLGAHSLVARILGYFSGWSVLPGNAGWWLTASLLLGGWLLLKLVLDASECRGALFTYMLAAACFLVAGALSAGLAPPLAQASLETMGRALPLAGNLMLLVGSLLFARYVVLDVQGLIEHKSDAESRSENSRGGKQHSEEKAQRVEKEVVAAKIPCDQDAWTDGSDIEYDEEPASSRRLSKAERKRLRKQKNRNRAA